LDSQRGRLGRHGTEVTLWSGLRGLRKDNTGYDLKQLYIGAEGTLGIITAAVLKLFPRHRQVETAFVAVPNPRAVLDLLTLAREVSGDGGVLAFEMIPRFALDLVVKHVGGATDPLATVSPWYVLADLTVPRATAEAFMAQALQHGLVSDGALAGSAAQAAGLGLPAILESGRIASSGLQLELTRRVLEPEIQRLASQGSDPEALNRLIETINAYVRQGSLKKDEYLESLAYHYGSLGRRDDMLNVLQQIKSHAKDFPQAYLRVGDFYLLID